MKLDILRRLKSGEDVKKGKPVWMQSQGILKSTSSQPGQL